ncbi:hypothetical protein, partial [Salmonella enterica]|uniref:hypothetical protein n=1 Tax=Salmonella enterica TaxID=28901 RepID=UPI003CE8A85F
KGAQQGWRKSGLRSKGGLLPTRFRVLKDFSAAIHPNLKSIRYLRFSANGVHGKPVPLSPPPPLMQGRMMHWMPTWF